MPRFLSAAVLGLLMGAASVQAQDGLVLVQPASHSATASPDPTGDLRQDVLAVEMPESDAVPLDQAPDGYKNPAIAFGLSAVLPGAGQVYNGNTLRAIAYAGLEVGLWAGYISWRSRGVDGEAAYQVFAHQDWSVARYAEWLNDYPGYGGEPLNTALIEGIDLMNPDGWSEAQRSTMLDFFEELRGAERQSRYVNADGTGTGATFSHVLEDFGEQQYYELIGKYFQYGPGWDDWCAGRDPDSAECLTLEDFNNRDQFAAKTDLFFEYAEDHAAANTLLRRASRVSSFVLLNHALSAFDALLTARFNNRGIAINSGVSLQPDGQGGSMPTAQLRVQF